MIAPIYDRQQTIESLRSLIHGMDVAMLTTQGADGKLRSRPMTPARHEFDGDLWFFALETSPFVADVQRNSAVNVAYAGPAQHQYISTTGTAEIVREGKKLELLWKDELKNLFPEGLATPHLLLVRIAVEEAEFWEQRVSSAEGFLSAMVSWKGSLEEVHERVQWSGQVAERDVLPEVADKNVGAGR